MFGFFKRKGVNEKKYDPLARDVFKAYNQFRPEGPQELLCYVPFSSLTFSWQGQIYACTYNRHIVIGSYPESSIRDIWFGEKLKKLQDHVAHHDLNYGCQHCKYFIERNKFSGLKPLQFDKYADYKEHPYPRVMEFELSNRCNLECIMCNGYASSMIRQNREKLPPLPDPYDEAFTDQLREFIPHLREAKFYGGEPFLISTYYRIFDLIMEINPAVNIFVITNGTILTEKVKGWLEKGDFNLAVSIDSIRKERYEYIRKHASFDEVMNNLEYFNNYAHSRGKTISLSFTTQAANWDELPEVIQFCNDKQMVFFNSFLKNPEEMSLIYMSSQKLKEIHAYLSRFDLPEKTELQRNNKRCYTDYLNYISQYIITNEEAERKGQPVNHDVPLTDSPTNPILKEDLN
jgi:radical SAM protein with 4Fe4S-binding SPASM domain